MIESERSASSEARSRSSARRAESSRRNSNPQEESFLRHMKKALPTITAAALTVGLAGGLKSLDIPYVNFYMHPPGATEVDPNYTPDEPSDQGIFGNAPEKVQDSFGPAAQTEPNS